LKAAIEVGVLGLFAFGFWLYRTVRHAWQAYRGASEAVIAWRALGLLAVAFAGMVMSLVDNYLGYTAVQWYFWALVALVPPRGQWSSAPR
jgi:O-antigen ligase